MNSEPWAAVDGYIAEHLVASDPILEAAHRASLEAGLPPIAVSPCQGQFLHLLARVQRPEYILELGALGGYSTICLARALPAHGKLISLELNPKHAQVAQANVARAGLAGQVEFRVGPALELLPQLTAPNHRPFDLIFIDADKANIPEYFQWALKLSRPGTLIIIDNVVRKGGLLDADSADPDIQGVRRLHEMLKTAKQVTATTLQVVGTKGWDGITLAVVNP